QAGFHTYVVEWDRSTSPEEIRFSLDGTTFHTVRANQVDAATWANATNHGYFVILNVAMGGGFPDAFGGGPDGGTEPGHPMTVDYVRVLQSSGGGGGTTPPPSSGNRNAYDRIEAESFDSQSGVVTEATTDSGGGQNIGSLANGDWALYNQAGGVLADPVGDGLEGLRGEGLEQHIAQVPVRRAVGDGEHPARRGVAPGEQRDHSRLRDGHGADGCARR
ncbi:carbohydrate-binding protein, partial [Streptomyces sp. NPDC004290]